MVLTIFTSLCWVR